MAPKKEVSASVKLQIPGGQATPAPPVGTALGPHGVNMGDFVKQFNDATREQQGMIIPCVVTIYADRSFSFEIKSPPAAVLIKKAIGLDKASGETGTVFVGSITRAQLEEIAEIKKADMNSNSVDAAVRVLAGTARSMGIRVEG
jgi:large subunit ribosomal protein L11